jgi:radical SAM superfamily enzyme YgiQ (UPF0313 family)
VNILLITPPFVQLNTPYPATPNLKGFLMQQKYNTRQADIGIELFNMLFSQKGLEEVFDIASKARRLPNSLTKVLQNRQRVLVSIDQVLSFLQGKDPTFAYRAVSKNYWPFIDNPYNEDDMEWMFGQSGIQDKAKYLSTLFIESIGKVITTTIDHHFAFSRYAESLGLSASSFDRLNAELQKPDTLLAKMIKDLVKEKLKLFNPQLVGITIPFPGNLYGGLKCCQAIKEMNADIKIVMGGGYINTELRSLSDPRIFDYADYICLDDGEMPLLSVIKYLEGTTSVDSLIKTFIKDDTNVKLIQGDSTTNIPFCETGIPDYSDLPLDQYLSFIEIANPMHRIWNDGRWNKLTLAHGCYWHQCAFCDTTLDYIHRYEAGTTDLIVSKMESMIRQTGQSGFHFTDEAAPPVLLRKVSEEIIKRGLQVTWWTNIRFEKTFDDSLCMLMNNSGCIAVTGGLETASDRLLKMMNKGVTVEQAASVAQRFQKAGIMVHAYLMYAFPTETEQETIDSLEIVRQFFKHNLLQSAFWHEFAMTVHSPIGKQPSAYHVEIANIPKGSFANNNLKHIDNTISGHHDYAAGLKKAVYNYMHGVGIDEPLKLWFNFKIQEPSIPMNYVKKILSTK